MWTALRTVLPSKKNASTSSNLKDLGPDDFNSFFTAVGLNLIQKFDTASFRHPSTLMKKYRAKIQKILGKYRAFQLKKYRAVSQNIGTIFMILFQGNGRASLFLP